MATKQELSIIISAKNAAVSAFRQAERQISSLGETTKRYMNTSAEESKKFATGAAIAGTAGVFAISRYGDEVQSMNNKLISVTGSQDKANDSFRKLEGIAKRSRSDLNGVVSGFQRFEMTNKALGISTQETYNLVETLSKGLQFSGATANEAASATLQLSQAYASGRLQGDEFRSLSESFPLLMRNIEKSLGVTTAQLKKMGSEGKITRDIISDALKQMKDDVDENLAEMPYTIGQSFSLMRTEIISAFQEINQSTHFFDNIANSIVRVGEYITQAVPKIISFTKSITPEQIRMFAGAIVGALTPAVIGLGFAFGKMMLTLAPWMTIGVLVAQNFDKIADFVKDLGVEIEDLTAVWGLLKEAVVAHMERIKAIVQTVAQEIMPLLKEFFKTIEFWVVTLKEKWKTNFLGIQDITAVVWEGIKAFISGAWEFISNLITSGIQFLRGDWKAAWESMKKALQPIVNGIKNIISVFWQGLVSLFERGKAALSNTWDAMWGGMKNTAIGIWEAVKQSMKDGINWMIGKINWLIDKINSIADAVPGVEPNLIPKIPMLAEGGIVTRPTLAMVGEGGQPEAVVPLSKAGSFGFGGGGSGTNVYITVEGSVLQEQDLVQTVSDAFFQELSLRGATT